MAQTDNQQNRSGSASSEFGGAKSDSLSTPETQESDISKEILKDLPPKLASPEPYKITPPAAPPAGETEQKQSPPSSLSSPPSFKPASPTPYRSSLRTMESDISELKKGKAPSGAEIEVKPPITPPKTQSPSIKAPPPIGLKPGSEIDIRLGKPEKTKPLEAPKFGEQIPPSSQFTIPPKKKRFSTVSIIIVVIGIVAIGVLAFLLFGPGFGPGDEFTVPTPTATATPQIPKLSEVLGTTEEIVIDSSQDDVNQQLLNGISFLNLNVGSFRILRLRDEFGVEYDFSRFTSDFGVNVPTGLVSNLDSSDWALFAFGQSEKFDSEGNFVQDSSISPVLGLSVKVIDTTSVRSDLNIWESTLSSNFNDLFNLDPQRADSAQFLDNTYKNSLIRYMNFPYPDKSIDYVILEPFFAGGRNVNYLIFTSSRESMYMMIDTLGGI